MKKRVTFIFLLFAALLLETVKADVTYTNRYTINISAVSIIRIYPVKTISLNLLTNSAGEAMLPKTDGTTYLQLTSIVPVSTTRRITVSMTGSLPTATLLKLTAQTSLTGSGTFGTPASTITLSSTSQTLINYIGSAYTLNSTTSGYKLTYTYMADPNNINKLFRSSARSVTLTYTILSN